MLDQIDAAIGVLLLPLALWIVVSGLDDLLIDILWLATRPRRRRPRAPAGGEKTIAIFVPLWHEHGVIRQMVEHNLSAIAYRDYHFFIGAYPNDPRTVDEVCALEGRHANVHLALCPHDGPTSKADCLNWIYQRMLLDEKEGGGRYELIVIHDAEDLIHSQALAEINRALDHYDTVQVPVFALPTPALELTHGVYCDEFAEYQTRDMAVREAMGAFVPSCGVGTGYRREALERIAVSDCNRIFDPACLTEDYENGLRLHELGCSQGFLPPARVPVATREFFPRNLRAAVRQRSRWITGNILQSWERHGWRGSLVDRYWLWRDRKGLAGTLFAALTNLITLYVAARWASGEPAPALSTSLRYAAPFTLMLLIWRLGMRAWFASRIYGWRFAAGAPVRMLYGNLVNALSCVAALGTWSRAKFRGEPLRWVKTEHAYPNPEALRKHKRSLEDILVSCAYLSEEELASAMASSPAQTGIGQYLVETGYLSVEELAEAESLREHRRVAPQVQERALRALPAAVVREWQVVPIRVEQGRLHVAAPRLPAGDVQRSLGRYTGLRIRFHLLEPERWTELASRVLPRKREEIPSTSAIISLERSCEAGGRGLQKIDPIVQFLESGSFNSAGVQAPAGYR